MIARRPSHLVTALLVVVIVVLGTLFLAWIGIDALEGRNDAQFFADSNTYHEAYREDRARWDNVEALVGISVNYLGPLAVIALAGDNYFLILVFNAALLLFCLRTIADSLKLDSLRLLLVLLLNPLTVSSVLSVNKEILAVLCFTLIVRGLAKRSFAALAGAVVISFLVRWQMTMFLVLLLVLTSSVNPLRRRRALTVLLLVATMSAAYVGLDELLAPVRLNFESSAAEYEGSGAFQWLMDQQDRGLYWLVFPLKAAHLLFASGLRFDRLLDPTVPYNDNWQLLHSTATLVMFIALVRKGRFSLSNDLVYLSVLYLAVFALTPIYTPRYFYPVYVLWAIVIISPQRPFQLFPVHRRVVARRPRRPRPAAPQGAVPPSQALARPAP